MHKIFARILMLFILAFSLNFSNAETASKRLVDNSSQLSVSSDEQSKGIKVSHPIAVLNILRPYLSFTNASHKYVYEGFDIARIKSLMNALQRANTEQFTKITRILVYKSERPKYFNDVDVEFVRGMTCLVKDILNQSSIEGIKNTLDKFYFRIYPLLAIKQNLINRIIGRTKLHTGFEHIFWKFEPIAQRTGRDITYVLRNFSSLTNLQEIQSYDLLEYAFSKQLTSEIKHYDLPQFENLNKIYESLLKLQEAQEYCGAVVDCFSDILQGWEIGYCIYYEELLDEEEI